MTALDRLGQQLVVGDLVQFQFANLPLQQHTITAIGPETDLHATLTLAGHPDIDSLSVEKVDPPIQSETSKYLEQLAKGPTKSEPQTHGAGSQTSSARTESETTPAPTTHKPKRAPAHSHKTTPKPTTKGTKP